jgi:hypothetical protein
MAASNIKLDGIPSLTRSDDPDLENTALQRTKNHTESHSSSGDVIRDVIIGFADGLTVPFALTAGLSSLVA